LTDQGTTDIHQWQARRREYPKISDFIESAWKDVLKKPVDKLRGIQCYGTVVCSHLWIFTPEGHLSVFQFRDAIVAYGHAVRVPGKILQYPIRGFATVLCKNDPILLVDTFLQGIDIHSIGHS